jgi:O-succinylbenzoate synthase
MARWDLQVRRVGWRLLEAMTSGPPAQRRETLELRLESGSRRGWGEAAPLPGLHSETLEDLELALPHLLTELQADVGEGDLLSLVSRLEKRLESARLPPSLRWAAAWALAEALGWRGPREQPPAPPSAGLLAGPPHRWAEEADAHPAACWKVKVGRHPPSEEAAALNALRRLHPSAELRLDANRAYTLEEARALQRACPELAPRWIEEPLADAAELAAWLGEGGWPLAIDESLAVAGVPVERAAAWVLKPQVLGLMRTLRFFDRSAAMAGPDCPAPLCVVSSSFESPRGLIVLEQLARLAPGRPAPGLGTRAWFEDQPEWEEPWRRL